MADGPSSYRLSALIAQAADQQAAVAAELARLRAIGDTAEAALQASVDDRAQLHDLIDALTARVAELELPKGAA